MKVMGNAWIVGGLCLIAASVVGYQVLGRRSPGAAAPAPNDLAPVPAAASSAIPPTRTGPQPRPGTNVLAAAGHIDLDYVLSHLTDWTETPRRDPFHLVPPARPGTVIISPVSRWKLKAIWRQTGSRLAAINQGVYVEGDIIEGCRLETIEEDRVWIDGPLGRESLSFAKPKPSHPALKGTNAPSQP